MENKGKDPWGDVYKICREERRANDFSILRNGDGFTNFWNESVHVLMDSFFPRDEVLPSMPVDFNLLEDKEFNFEEIVAAILRLRQR